MFVNLIAWMMVRCTLYIPIHPSGHAQMTLFPPLRSHKAPGPHGQSINKNSHH